ncbi:MAG TPA: hypothetical protein VFR23_19685 [Jiangellaceae bacterium]|nr:hypothetical protein [Jiangellaceae bacterium]
MASISGTGWERFDRLVGDFSSVSICATSPWWATIGVARWGGAELLITHGRAIAWAGLVLVACEAFDNDPPGVPGRW